jgi:hypothetical protein
MACANNKWTNFVKNNAMRGESDIDYLLVDMCWYVTLNSARSHNDVVMTTMTISDSNIH